MYMCVYVMLCMYVLCMYVCMYVCVYVCVYVMCVYKECMYIYAPLPRNDLPISAAGALPERSFLSESQIEQLFFS